MGQGLGNYAGIEGNDGGLLELLGGVRAWCDEIARLVADHNRQHHDHGITECGSEAPFVIAHMLTAQGGALTLSGANLLEAHLASHEHGHDDSHGDAT